MGTVGVQKGHELLYETDVAIKDNIFLCDELQKPQMVSTNQRLLFILVEQKLQCD